MARSQPATSSHTLGRLLADPPPTSSTAAGWALLAVRLVSGLIFIAFGAGKFLNHASETHSFAGYGLPAPSLFTLVIGVLELVGGVMLVLGWRTRIAAVLLAADMIGAIVTSGLMHGERVSLTLAPALLVAMAVLAAYGPGRRTVKSHRSAAPENGHSADQSDGVKRG
jgi:putative oxidoreductase